MKAAINVPAKLATEAALSPSPALRTPRGQAARFGSQEALLEAAETAYLAGYRKMDAYSPVPIDGLDEALGSRKTIMPLLVLLGGIIGGVSGYFMQWYSMVIDYPYNVGGRPFHSWPSFIPVTFELTVLRGHLDEDTAFATGKNDDGTLAAAFPMPVAPELPHRGQERFTIYCSMCHGAEGDGNGMVVQRGYPPPPSYHIGRLRNALPGYLFSVITHGYGIMYPYASRVEASDRWAIAAYIRALQLSRTATLDDVPADERAKLEASAKP